MTVLQRETPDSPINAAARATVLLCTGFQARAGYWQR